jgi:hypothetical protein
VYKGRFEFLAIHLRFPFVLAIRFPFTFSGRLSASSPTTLLLEIVEGFECQVIQLATGDENCRPIANASPFRRLQ